MRTVRKPGAEAALLGQKIPWRPAGWRSDLPGHGSYLDEIQRISDPFPTREREGEEWSYLSRGTVLQVARRGDPLLTFLASMVWGFGPGGRRWRVAQALGYREDIGPDDADERIAALYELARTAEPEDAFRQAVPNREDSLHLPGIGMSFATKFLYFSAFEVKRGQGKTAPLIFDEVVADALGCSPPRTSKPEDYGTYLSVARAWAGTVREDLVEHALFQIGNEQREKRRRRRSRA